METLDADVLARLFADIGNDDAAMREIVSAFLRQTPELLAEGERAARARDGPTVRRVVHTLKGTGLTFGAVRLASLCKVAEAHAESGRLDEAFEALVGIRKECDRVAVELGAWLEA